MPVGVQQPAYIDFEVAGQAIAQVTIVGGQYDENGRRRLLLFTPLASSIDGVYEDFFVWDTEAPYLSASDGSGDYVVTRPVAGDRSLFAVRGHFRHAADSQLAAADLIVDNSGTSLHVQERAADGSAGTATIEPQPGDVFQPDILYLDNRSNVVPVPGPALTFGDAGQLTLTQRALPNGRYFFGISAEAAGNRQAEDFVELTVNNDAVGAGAVSGTNTYLDPELGFQFRYPDDWQPPAYSNSLLVSTARTTPTQMQITLHPNLDGSVDAAALKAAAMQQFGPVTVLFADQVLVAGQPGLRTAYGYTGTDGAPRTGLLFAFVRSGTGFVVDVEGLQADEAATITAVDTIINSWQFRPTDFNAQQGRWTTVKLDTFSVAKPAGFVSQSLDDWQRFSSGRDTFLALTVQPSTRTADAAVTALLRQARAGTDNFEAEAPRPFPPGGAAWQRADFTYTADGGVPIWGFVMTKIEAGQEIAAWAEAPANTYNELETAVFLTMLADMELQE